MMLNVAGMIDSLSIMWQGMLGIFVAIGAIMIVVKIIGSFKDVWTKILKIIRREK